MNYQVWSILSVNLLAQRCSNSSTEPAQSISSPDLPRTRSYLHPAGGDPRGRVGPNSPFLWYFGVQEDALTQNSGVGILELSDQTANSGTFTFQGRALVAGRIGNTLYSAIPRDENASGNWTRYGTRIILEFPTRKDTVSYGSDSTAFYFITSYVSNVPPTSLSNTVMPPWNQDTSVWVFKR